MGRHGGVPSDEIGTPAAIMTFKEWIRLSETKSSVRYRPTGGALNTGFLRGSAASYGHTDAPDPLEKGLTSIGTGLGSSLRKSLEDDTGLVVQGVGRMMSPPSNEEDVNAHYNFLPLQLPQYTHNKNQIVLNRINLNSNRMFKDVMNINDANIRQVSGDYGMEKGAEMEGAFTLLYEDENGKLNGDYNQAKQFTTALIYRLIVDGLKSSGEIEKYNVDKMEVIGEEVSDEGVLLVWFRFEEKDMPQTMKGGRPDNTKGEEK